MGALVKQPSRLWIKFIVCTYVYSTVPAKNRRIMAIYTIWSNYFNEIWCYMFHIFGSHSLWYQLPLKLYDFGNTHQIVATFFMHSFYIRSIVLEDGQDITVASNERWGISNPALFSSLIRLTKKKTSFGVYSPLVCYWSGLVEYTWEHTAKMKLATHRKQNIHFTNNNYFFYDHLSCHLLSGILYQFIMNTVSSFSIRYYLMHLAFKNICLG